MIIIPPIIPGNNHSIKEPHVAEKDPHHEQNKRKKEQKQESEIEDTIDISHEEEKQPQKPHRQPISPLEGHIDIDA